MPFVRRGEFRYVVDRAALLSPGDLRSTDHPAQPPVPLRVTGEHQQMPSCWVGDAALPAGQVQAELGTEDRTEPGAARLFHASYRLGELRHSVHAVMIGDG